MSLVDPTLDGTETEVRDLAADVMKRLVSPERLQAVEATPDRFDRELWAELARTGLLGVAVPEEHGGLGFGMVALGLVAEQIGRAVAAVPFVAATVAATAIAHSGTPEQQRRWLPGLASGDVVFAVAPRQCSVAAHVDAGRLSGHLVAVPWAHVADRLLVDVDDGLYLLAPSDAAVSSQRVRTTGGQIALDILADAASVERVGDAAAVAGFRGRWLTTLAATQAGVCDAAVRITADYTSTREQFGKPLSTFQGVALKAADAYVDATAIAAVAQSAAWTLDAGLPARLAVLTAAWWAAEAGQHCVHITQHLHGGMGADVTYPVHRYFLWGKQIELLLGGASTLLADLGDALAVRPDAGDAIVLD